MDKIQCPNCAHQFDVESALAGKLEAQYKKEMEQKIAAQAQLFKEKEAQLAANAKAQADALAQAQADFEAKKQKENEIFAKRLDQQLKLKVAEERNKIELLTKEQFENKVKLLSEENEKRKNENKALKEKELQLLQKEAALKEQQEELKLQAEKEFLQRQKEIEDKARAKEREQFELEKLKYQKQIDDQKKLVDEMKRKAEQGSQQLQGEIQELALEHLLGGLYPFDQISEVPKGVRGADIIQTVVNGMQQDCGRIVYESKRTKNFANDWIDKLKQDQITCKADLAIIVTETMPSDMDKFGEKNGVWICGYHEVKSVSFVLREMLIKTQSVKASQENKGDKMELLYNYLTSSEFKQNVQRIVENYESMHLQLVREKRAMAKIWSEREKQIDVVQSNISALFGSIKGIGGNLIQDVEILELPD